MDGLTSQSSVVPDTVPVAEACRLLGGISYKTLYHLMGEGHIATVSRARPGRRRYRRPVRESVIAYAKTMAASVT